MSWPRAELRTPLRIHAATDTLMNTSIVCRIFARLTETDNDAATRVVRNCRCDDDCCCFPSLFGTTTTTGGAARPAVAWLKVRPRRCVSSNLGLSIRSACGEFVLTIGSQLAMEGSGCRNGSDQKRPDLSLRRAPAAANLTHNVEDSMNRLMMTLGAFLMMGILTAPPLAAQDKPAAKPAKTAASPAAPVNVNTATQAQLETLPGIGAAAAKRIIEYRDKNGKFKKVEELMNVKGIGEKSFLKLKPMITVGAEAPDAPAVR